MTGGTKRSGRIGGQERWVTVHGELSGAELDAACVEMGVPGGRDRRRRWQTYGLFPLPTRASTSASRARGAYHRGSPALAAFVHAMTPVDSERPGPADVNRVADAIRLLRLRANDRGDSLLAEDLFYEAVRAAIDSLREQRTPAPVAREVTPVANRRAGAARPAADPPRWVTSAGSLTTLELEVACAARGVHLDRSRRTYWQAERVFPQPERRLLRPPEGRGGARGYYHPGAVDLAYLIDYAARADHPTKSEVWRCTVRDLAPVISRWRAEAASAGGTTPEEAFYSRIRELTTVADEGRPIPDTEPRHRDILPPDQRRVDDGEREEAVRTTAQVAQAIVDRWVADHDGEPSPERLVVWFRLERAGPEFWRIADAGARRTSHESQRTRESG